MTAVCQAPIQGTTMRVQTVNSCGTPLVGSCVSAVSTGFVSVEMQDQVEAGQEIVVLNAAGVMCVNEKSPKQLKWIEVTITFCNVDPELFGLITGSTLVLNNAATPAAVGFQTRTSNYAAGAFALEVWTNMSNAQCVTIGTFSLVPYGYFLLPNIVEGTVGDLKIENSNVSFTVSGRTKQGTNWGVGPKTVLANMTNGTASSLLVALPNDTHRHLQWTYLAPPAASCGCAS
jgi:hypothetical protein